MDLKYLFVMVLLASTTAPAYAQQSGGSAVTSNTSAYPGVRLGTPNPPPRATGLRDSRHRWVTWPGMEIRPGSGGRFFVQVTGPVETETHREDGRVVVLLRRSRIHLANNRHPLESRFFNTPVNRAWLERRGRDVAFVLDLRADVMPQVVVQEGADGYRFVVVSFAGGDYLPAAMRQPAPSPTAPAASPRANELPGDIRALDHERPPVLQDSGN